MVFLSTFCQDHEETCTRFPLSCPESCGEVNIPRELLDDHIQNHCPLAQVVCPYSIYGCSFKVSHGDAQKELHAFNLHNKTILWGKGSTFACTF